MPLPKWNAFPKPSKFVFECELFIITFGIHSWSIPDAFGEHSECIRNVFHIHSECIPIAFGMHSSCMPTAPNYLNETANS